MRPSAWLQRGAGLACNFRFNYLLDEMICGLSLSIGILILRSCSQHDKAGAAGRPAGGLAVAALGEEALAAERLGLQLWRLPRAWRAWLRSLWPRVAYRPAVRTKY